MLPMPCDECETCYWLREMHGRKRCAHERPETDASGSARVCLSYERRRDEDWAALVYGNGDVDPRRC